MTDGYTRFVSGLLFPLHERLKRHVTVPVMRSLEESQWWSADRIEHERVARLRRFLADIGAHVPYYRALFRATGFDPGSVRKTSDLGVLPLLGKAEIRANLDAMKADDARRLSRFNTGGSSGEPLVFYIGDERVSHDVAAKWRATRWWGVDIGDPEIVVWGSPIELGAQDRLRSMRDRLLRTELLPAFEMSEAKLDDFLDRIRKRRPRMLFGYPSALSHIGLYAEKQRVRMDELGIRVAFCTSERLYEHQRQAIERVFGCPVANGYGSRDAGFIAHQCPEGSLHLTAEDIIVEIIAGDGTLLPPGEAGEIVVTHLATRDFPFVRYRTGDIGVLATEPCACGRGLPVLHDVQGRATDFVVARDGTVMHGLALIYVLRDMGDVAGFKIVQEDLDLTRVLVVPGEGFDVATEQAIRDGLGARLGSGVEVRVERVAEIPADKSGKFRYVVSRAAAADGGVAA